jgi:hypothetical protein
MIRRQIQLTDDQARGLKELAERHQVSISELIRQAVDQIIADGEYEEKRRRASAVIGSFKGGPADVSANHDKYLDEAYL